jgi:hypothetical protein
MSGNSSSLFMRFDTIVLPDPRTSGAANSNTTADETATTALRFRSSAFNISIGHGSARSNSPIKSRVSKKIRIARSDGAWRQVQPNVSQPHVLR